MSKLHPNIKIQLLSKPYLIKIKDKRGYTLINTFQSSQPTLTMNENTNVGFGDGTLLACKVRVSYISYKVRCKIECIMIFSELRYYFVWANNTDILKQRFTIMHDRAVGGWKLLIEQLQLSNKV